jgi:hypothetical protein
VLYDRVRGHGHGYPDVITTAEGELFITETYKSSPQSEARVHHVSSELVKLLFSQEAIDTAPALATGDVTLPAGGGGANGTAPTVMVPSGSVLPDMLRYKSRRYGLSISLDLSLHATQHTARATTAEQSAGTHSVHSASTTSHVLVDARHWSTATASSADTDTATTTTAPQPSKINGGREDGNGTTWSGLLLSFEPANGTISIELRDTGGTREGWITDPVCSAQLLAHMQAKTVAHAAVVIDAGPQMVLFMVDGRLCDGGPTKDLPDAQKGMFSAGWHLMQFGLGDLSGVASLGVGSAVQAGAVYGRALYTTELIGAYRASALLAAPPGR